MEPQVSIGKDSKDKFSAGEINTSPSPPTTQELKDYALQIGYDSFNPEAFLAYYSANDWKTANGNPITSWKKQVDLWKVREKDHSTRFPSSGSDFNNIEQHDYDFNLLEKALVVNE